MLTNKINNSKSSNVVGTMLATLAFASLAIINALVKEVAHTTPIAIIIFYQSLFCLLAVIPVILFQGLEKLKTSRIGIHFIRAAAGTGAWIGLFMAITLMPLADAVLLTYSAPIWIPLIAWVLHRRKARRMVWVAVCIGFVGIALVLHPTTSTFNWGAPIALCAAILLALALLSIRWLNKTEPDVRILFYFFFLSTLFIFPIALLNWQIPSPSSWIYLLGIGGLLLVSQIFLIAAYKYASAVTLAPIIYTIILFTALINWMVWHQIPSLIEILGMILIILGGLITMNVSSSSNENID